MTWLKRCSLVLPSLVLILAATPLASALRLSTPADVWMVRPCFCRLLASCALTFRILDGDDAVQ
jgi:hypothetical protein